MTSTTFNNFEPLLLAGISLFLWYLFKTMGPNKDLGGYMLGSKYSSLIGAIFFMGLAIYSLLMLL